MKRVTQIILFALLLWGLAPHAALAHKFHESLTQMEYNRETRSVEITIRMFADDLEAALSKRSGKSVRLDKTPDVGAMTLDYLKHAFVFKNCLGETKRLVWVGMETQVDVVWVFVEVEMPEELPGSELRNRIFFDLFQDQINRVGIKNGEKKADLVFKPGDGFKSIFQP